VHLVRGVAPELRKGLQWEVAAATVRALSAPEVYSELVHGEGWDTDRYESWLADLLAGELLGR
jgi:hypothetical protein